MSVETVLYDALSALPELDAVFDTKVPDNYVLAGTIALFQDISTVPDSAIDGDILGKEQRWQVTVRAIDLLSARAARTAIETALHGLQVDPVKWCEFENAQGAVEFNEDGRREYFIPIDFMISL